MVKTIISNMIICPPTLLRADTHHYRIDTGGDVGNNILRVVRLITRDMVAGSVADPPQWNLTTK